MTTQETAVLDALKETMGYFTIFWATANQYRQAAIERLTRRGVIEVETLGFPAYRATIKAGL